MALTVRMDEALTTRRRLVLANGTGYFRTDYLGRDAPVTTAGPTCYLIEQDPNSIIPPHFHQSNQFQVVVFGGGRLGKKPVRALAVHYANAYTPYGPIEALEQGLHYFTLRDALDPGARFLPDARAELPAVRHARHALGEPVEPLGDAGLAELAAIDRRTIIAPQADGLAAWLTRLPAYCSIPAASGGGGCFHLVIAGSLLRAGDELRRHDCLHVAADEPPLDVLAGREGAEFLTLYFPDGTA